MVFSIPAEHLLSINRVYTVVRKTVWQVADPSHILLLIADGCCRIEMGSVSAVVRAGDAVFIPAGQIYRRSPVDDSFCSMMYIHFSTKEEVSELENDEAARRISEAISRADRQLLDGKNNFVAVDEEMYLAYFNTGSKDAVLEHYRDFSKAARESRSYNGLYMTYGVCRLLSIISHDLRRAIFEGEMDKELLKIPANLKKAVWYIKQNEAGHLSLEELCRYCNVSPSQMIRYFKDAFGKTPIQYINEYKVNRAREMIQTTQEIAIKNVCDALGFDDPHYFSRIFSKITGESPRAYKDRVVNFGKK